MQNLKSVETSTQVGSEEKKSSQRERKSLTNSLCRVLEKVYEDEGIESMSEFEDDYYDSEVVYNEDDYEDDDWKERSFEDVQELIDESEIPQEDNEE